MVLLALRFAGGFAGGGTVPSGMAMLGDRYTGKTRQIAIGRFVGAGLFGQIFSASLAGVIAVTLGWRNTFLLAGAVAACAAVAATLYLREPPGTPKRSFTLAGAIDGYRMVFSNPRAYVCFATVCAEGIALWGVTPYVAELLIRSGTGTTREAGLIIGGIGVGGLLFTLILPTLLRLLGRTAMMATGGILGTAGLIGLILDFDWITIAALFCLSGFGYMMLHNSIQNESVELAPTARSSAYSMHAFFFFTGQSLGPVIFGIGLTHAGPEAALYLCAAIFAITGIAAGSMFAALDRA
jgi:predicted MFS family arabinose efflux permease